jgi:hypothetical protein
MPSEDRCELRLNYYKKNWMSWNWQSKMMI